MKKFKELYKSEITPALKTELGLDNVMMLPRLEKICLNMGVGEAAKDSKVIDKAFDELKMIANQKPVICNARKSNASFKIRTGMPIGVKVTLRKDKMFEFLERLVLVALPRLRDFRGFTDKNFDGNGNFSFGMKEQIVFPEIDYDNVDTVRGLDITFVTSTKDNNHSKALLKKYNIPFKD